jgi:hypothetical protein
MPTWTEKGSWIDAMGNTYQMAEYQLFAGGSHLGWVLLDGGTILNVYIPAVHSCAHMKSKRNENGIELS